VNCSAYNAVDAAETDASSAFAVNARGPATLAAAARRTAAVLVHFSSDFVFDGAAETPYDEDSPTHPLNVYGASKLAGETEARRAGRYYVLRLESNFGGAACNGQRATVDQITDNIIARRPVRAVVDRTVSPSYVVDVARATRLLLERRAADGIYHCVNSGFTTWYDLAQKVAALIDVPAEITPVMSTDLKVVAPRPRFCALSNRKLRQCGIEMPGWESALERHLMTRGTAVPAVIAREHDALPQVTRSSWASICIK
jgi:dTDP-4-dehydrorhamnose reductase